MGTLALVTCSDLTVFSFLGDSSVIQGFDPLWLGTHTEDEQILIAETRGSLCSLILEAQGVLIQSDGETRRIYGQVVKLLT